MNKEIKNIEIHRQDQKSLVVIYYNNNTYYSFDGDEDELAIKMNMPIEKIRNLFDVSYVFHPKMKTINQPINRSQYLPRPQYQESISRGNGHYSDYSYDSRFEFRSPKSGDLYRRMQRRKYIITFVAIGTIVVALGIGIVIVKKNNFKKALMFHNSKMMEYHNLSGRIDQDDKILYENYESFIDVFNKLKDEDYKNLSKNDIKFFGEYLDSIFNSNNDNYMHSSYHSAFALSFINEFENLPAQVTMIMKNIEQAYNSIFGYNDMNSSYNNKKVPSFSEKKAKDFCKLAIDYIKDNHTYNTLPKVEKMILLKQLQSIVTKINYQYPTYDHPNSWVSIHGYDYDQFVESLNKSIHSLQDDLEGKCFDYKKM